MDHQVTVISLYSPSSSPLEITPYAKVFRVDTKTLDKIPIVRNTAFNFSLVSFVKLLRLFKSEKFDLIHGNKLEPLFSFALAKYLKSIPCVLTMHTPYIIHGPMDTPSKGLRKIFDKYVTFPSYHLAELSCAKMASRVITVSQSLADTLASWGVNRNKIKVIHNGIDTKKFAPVINSERVKQKLGLKRHVVLFVGRLEKRKGPDLLVRAIPEIKKVVKDVSFLFVGDDNTPCSIKNVLREIVAKLGCEEDVLFYGKASESELLSFYSCCDVFVVPSRYESFGLIVGEAMSMAKPVVAAKVGGIPEIIADGEDGLLFEPNNPQSLASKTIAVLQDAELAHRLSLNARRKIEENFNVQTMAKKTIALYSEVCNA